jgi:E3 ubiquitin-protein ligase XIAP
MSEEDIVLSALPEFSVEIQISNCVLYGERIATFKTWPKAMPITAAALCTAGFYYTGLSDRVICFYCGLGLNEWNPTDDPILEHVKHSPNCGYIKIFIEKQKEQQSASNDISRCKICFKNTSNILCVPCKHVSSCDLCVLQYNEICPICRCIVTKHIKVFIA